MRYQRSPQGYETSSSIKGSTMAEQCSPISSNSKSNPKVIVEHQPLPSIYELQENSSLNDDTGFDSGLSEESSEGDEEGVAFRVPYHSTALDGTHTHKFLHINNVNHHKHLCKINNKHFC